VAISYEDIKLRLNSLHALSDSGSIKRKKKALSNFRYFVKTYLPHYLDGNSKEQSAFRNWVYNELPDKSQTEQIILLFGYRGSAKTTLVSRALSLWRALKKKAHYAVHISDGAELSTENVEAIRLEFEENERIKQDFTIERGWEWTSKSIIVKIDGHLMKIQAFGSGSRMRGKNFLGHRPDDIYVDDLENDINIESRTQRQKLTKWVIKTVFKLPDRNKPFNIFILGTVLHFDSVLIRLSKRSDVTAFKFSGILQFPKNMHLWEAVYKLAIDDRDSAFAFYRRNVKLLHEELLCDDSSWTTHKKGMLYPVIFSLMLDYFEDKVAFFEEIQMDSIDEESQIFKLQFYDVLPSDLVYFLGTDPALGKAKGDFSAAVVLGKSLSLKKYFVVDVFIAKVHPDILGEWIIKFAIKYHLHKAAMETVQFQEYYASKIKEKSIDESVHVPIVGLKNSHAKEIRVESIAPDVNDGTILFNPNMRIFNEQFQMYPKGHDDAPDALEMAYRVAHYNTADFTAVKAAQKEARAKFKYLKGRF